jgi:hypothetical protein
MKAVRKRATIAVALACGLSFASTAPFARQGTPMPTVSVKVQPQSNSQPHKQKKANGQSYDGIDFLGSNCLDRRYGSRR